MSVRDAVWRLTAPVRWLCVGLIRAYRLVFAGAFGGHCRFSPSCSHYTEQAIAAHGVVRGVGLAVWRLLRCNPFGNGGVEQIPDRVALHDAVIPDGTPQVEVRA
jgi:putative membrane protein insertion efficiency factor